MHCVLVYIFINVSFYRSWLSMQGSETNLADTEGGRHTKGGMCQHHSQHKDVTSTMYHQSLPLYRALWSFPPSSQVLQPINYISCPDMAVNTFTQHSEAEAGGSGEFKVSLAYKVSSLTGLHRETWSWKVKQKNTNPRKVTSLFRIHPPMSL